MNIFYLNTYIPSERAKDILQQTCEDPFKLAALLYLQLYTTDD